jgi:hypothetical protein
MKSYIELKNEIYTKHPRLGEKIGSQINYKGLALDIELINDITESTSFLPTDSSIVERIHCITNNITEVPLCPILKTPLKFNKATRKYSMSISCISKLRKKPAYTNHKDRYKDIKDELYRKVTTGDFIQLTRDSIIEKYDSIKRENMTPNEINNNFDLFCNIMDLTAFLPDSTSNWTERIYCIKNGITSRLQDPTNGEYVKFLNRYSGYAKHSCTNSVNDHRRNNIVTYIENCGFEFIGFDYREGQIYKANIRCKTCNTTKKTLTVCGHWKRVYCEGCCGVIGRSKTEQDIVNFLGGYGIDTEKNITGILGKKEIDIYNPQHRIGIEFCGILWHSFGNKYPRNDYLESKKKHDHLLKHKICNTQNIKLLTIFENEWLTKNDIVKSVILAKFGVFAEKINGRDCKFEIISKKVADEFLVRTHLQGKCTSSLHCGLFYKDELVACMTFGRRKITRGKSKFELLRFSTKLNTQVHGGASKLFKHALGHINEDVITTYSDKRYGSKTFYEQLGFKLIRETPPNYFYTKNCIQLEGRIKYQKKKLKKFDSYDDNKTETQIMMEEGYRKIYDCGNYVFEYNNQPDTIK